MNVIDELNIFFSYEFVRRAVITGLVISLCAALLGTSLVLKRYAMIGDGLSHVGFGSLAIATALDITDVTLTVSLPAVIIAAFLLLRIRDGSRINGDSAIAVISTVSLAVGYIVMYRNGTNVDISNYMFGNIFTITRREAVWSIILAVCVVILFAILYNRIFAVTFDEVFASAAGMNVRLYNAVIAVLTAVVVVIGMKMMGTLLISALIIFPSLISMRLCKSFRGVVICAAAVSVICFMAGVIIAHLFDMPAGSTVVLMNVLLLMAVSAIKAVKSGIC